MCLGVPFATPIRAVGTAGAALDQTGLPPYPDSEARHLPKAVGRESQNQDRIHRSAGQQKPA